MFARNVSVLLKPDTLGDFTQPDPDRKIAVPLPSLL